MLITAAVLISPLLMTDMYPSLAKTLNLPPIIAGVPKSAIERINVRKNTEINVFFSCGIRISITTWFVSAPKSIAEFIESESKLFKYDITIKQLNDKNPKVSIKIIPVIP